MEKYLRRTALVELLGTFGLVYIAAGVVCGNYLTTPADQLLGPGPGFRTLGHQPGLVGIALANGFIYAALLAVTLPVSGGYLNPAVTLMLWVFNKISTKRTAWLIGAQLIGALLAGIALRYTFEPNSILLEARMGVPHLNRLAYPEITPGTIVAGTVVELILTFFLVFAIFGGTGDSSRTTAAALPAGLVWSAATLAAYYLTGAALNPARRLGPALCEFLVPEHPQNPLADLFVYVAGPVLGALLAGTVYFKLIAPVRTEPKIVSEPASKPTESKTAVMAGRGKK